MTTMTLTVYRINAETGARTLVRAQHTVKPATVPEVSSGYPACRCPRCSAAGKGRSRGRAQ
ncbi:hypothetical protein GCM10023080_050380 [Streptomyces pseudoechinosporeus]